MNAAVAPLLPISCAVSRPEVLEDVADHHGGARLGQRLAMAAPSPRAPPGHQRPACRSDQPLLIALPPRLDGLTRHPKLD